MDAAKILGEIVLLFGARQGDSHIGCNPSLIRGSARGCKFAVVKGKSLTGMDGSPRRAICRLAELVVGKAGVHGAIKSPSARGPRYLLDSVRSWLTKVLLLLGVPLVGSSVL